MLKTIKLNTINLTSDIFSSQTQIREISTLLAKVPNSFNKRFKYTYKKSFNSQGDSKKQRKYTIDLAHQQSNDQGQSKTNENKTILIGNKQQQKYRKTNKSKQQQAYLNNFILNIGKSNKKVAKIRHNSQSISSNDKNITQRTQNSFIPTRQNNNLSRLNNQIVEQERSNLIKIQNPGQNKQRTKHVNGFTKNTREKDFIKNTNSKRHNSNIRPKYFNSIIQSYKIKSIQLADPITGKGKSNRKFNPPPQPYVLDLRNDDNLREIYIQDVQKIQLQRLKIDNRRLHSQNHLKKRPLTSKSKKNHEDFEPQPWQSQQRHEFSYGKQSISLV